MYLPRRSVFMTLCPARRDVELLPRLVATDHAHRVLRTLDLHVLDLLADDVAFQIASHHLDLRKLHPRSPPVARRGAPRCAREASRAACCSASFFERPTPVPNGSRRITTVAVNSF